jgi:hypothetical protein
MTAEWATPSTAHVDSKLGQTRLVATDVDTNWAK